MIVSASYKTDIPAFYADWFRRRLAAGWCEMVNPYGRQIYTVPLDADSVDGFVFWTRNIAPFMPVLDELREADRPFVVQFTVTGYPSALDRATIAAARATGLIREMSERFGRRAVVWRYDPIVFSSLTPADWHRETFAAVARDLAGAVDEVVVSFAQIYRKTRRNLDRAAARFDFTWRDPDAGEKQELLADLAAIAADNGLALTLCGQPELLANGLVVPGVDEAACIDAARLADVAGRPVAAARKPHRQGCRCWASRDIGDYDSCPHGCTYCYAVSDRNAAKRAHARHDPRSSSLAAAGLGSA
jgi:hypothetical protein